MLLGDDQDAARAPQALHPVENEVQGVAVGQVEPGDEQVEVHHVEDGLGALDAADQEDGRGGKQALGGGAERLTGHEIGFENQDASHELEPDKIERKGGGTEGANYRKSGMNYPNNR